MSAHQTETAPLVAVIIPAYNAAKILHIALESLQAQTFPDWEVIVVDDGSQDATAATVQHFAAQDQRIRLIQQANQGVSTARNAGIAAARAPWLLFLDADDYIAPRCLERMHEQIEIDRGAGIVMGGWVRVNRDGVALHQAVMPTAEDYFALMGHGCPFVIHSCLVRRELVQSVGGFDQELAIGEDWDLWQRLFRLDIRIRRIHETLAFYTTHPNSASQHARRFLADGLKVVERVHRVDPRIAHLGAKHAAGNPPALLAGEKLHYCIYPAGMAIAGGHHAADFLDVLAEPTADLRPDEIAALLLLGIMNTLCLHETEAPKALLQCNPLIDAFLNALETFSGSVRLAHRIRSRIDRLALLKADARPLTIGTVHAIRLELAATLADITIPAGCEYLICDLSFNQLPVGKLELPVTLNPLPAEMIADAAAAQHFWPILQRAFSQAHYRNLEIVSNDRKVTARRNGEVIIRDQPLYGDDPELIVHDAIGWDIFLREIWNRPQWSSADFYEANKREGNTRRIQATAPLRLEVGEEIPDIQTRDNTSVQIEVLVGGARFGMLELLPQGNLIRAQQIRYAITVNGGVEFCRTAVRQALIGQSFDPTVGLQQALARRKPAPPRSAQLLLQRRAQQPPAIAGSRYVPLPAAASDDLIAAAHAAGETFIERNSGDLAVLYDPGQGELPLLRNPEIPHERKVLKVHAADRSFFESLFAKSDNPWVYNGPYEQLKYEQTLEMFPAGPIEDALEIACAEGHFTLHYAPRVKRLLATDISQIALERAAARCAEQQNIKYRQLDLVLDPIPGTYDLIVCSEMLYYLGNREALKTAVRKLAAALKPGGYLITAHANLVVDAPDEPGYNWDQPFGAKVIGETIARELTMLRELYTPAYRVQAFRRETQFLRRMIKPPVQRTTMAQPTELPVAAAKDFLPQGGKVYRAAEDMHISTAQLPILMYHSVAEAGPQALARWRVTPAQFEAQLRYLRDLGYSSVTPDEWGAALAGAKPLPGRKVLLTFDDGFRDFLSNAWPLLRRYGFSATVFLVADAVGKTNTWDHAYGEPIPLLDWDEIRALQADGVYFGSHTATHRPLSGLRPSEIVQEAARSRAILCRELGSEISTIAYPYGDLHPADQLLISGSGYSYGFTCRNGRSTLKEQPLALSRIEVRGEFELREFIAALG